MSRLSTSALFFAYIEEEFTWRHKEMIDISLTIKKTPDKGIKRSLLRAALPLLYAHWEGFIKKSSEAVISFVAEQRLRHDQLAACFWVLGVKKELNILMTSGNAHEAARALERILASGALRTRFNAKGHVLTESNLSSKVLEKIAGTIGVDYSVFESSAPLIDTSLVDRRNHIAHGQLDYIEEDRFTSLMVEIFGLMRTYRNAIENMVARGDYKNQNHQTPQFTIPQATQGMPSSIP
ncbi:MAE_28990/MAE_18760 family HEPN-like nuclease [Corallococcus interemptor]|uniref:MAE_28990/MAE_18760 family HEPN-like nuclease n=1 Tax=Corallococcus interemptor TaxID=2316720 RepID=UPI003D0012BC